MGRKPSARKVARRVLLFVVPAFIIGYVMVSVYRDDHPSDVQDTVPELPPPPPPLPPRYEISKHATKYSPNGGTKEYGNLHNLDCGEQGALMGFQFNYDDVAEMVNNDFTCLTVVNGEIFGKRWSTETPVSPSGSKWSSRNSMQQMSSHNVDCGEQFISQFKMKQWSASMTVGYVCTGTKTPAPQDCERSKSALVGRSDKASAFADAKVRCAVDTALTQFTYHKGVFEYTCCPKPQLK